MLSVKDIMNAFSSTAEPQADNDTYKQIFTTSELSQLYSLVKPYIASGHIGEFTLKRGNNASSLTALNDGDPRKNNVVFCIVKYNHPGEAVKYNLNCATSKLNLETLNFPELVRVCRLQLATCCGAPKTPEFRVV